MTIKLISLNVRGLRDPLKRRAIFNYYRQRGDFLCLQETHSDENCERIWTSKWGGEALYSHGTSNSKGVCILYKKNISYKVSNSILDKEGRYVICELKSTEDPANRVTICNIYSPNKDCPTFYSNMIQKATELAPELIILGDFNFVQNVDLDRKGSRNNLWKNKKVMDEVSEELMLTDVWRDRNPDEKIYTWMRTRPDISASRLDYGLVSQGMSSNVINTGYLPGINSDHRAFYLFLD